MIERTVSATEARVHFGELLDAVAEKGDAVIVERAGRPLAVVVSIDEWRRRRSTDAGGRWTGVDEMMRAHWAYMREKYGDTLNDIDWAEEIRAGREERDEQIINAVLGR
jgi:prevent-host-death family protein